MTTTIAPAAKAITQTSVVRKRRNGRRAVGYTLRYLALLPIIVFSIGPFFWMLRTAFTPASETFSLTPSFLPQHITFDNFVRVVTSATNPFVQQFGNTFIVAISATFLALVIGLTGAYALARLSFRGRGPLAMGMILVQFFPPVLLVIPLFVVLSHIGLSNSLVGLIIAFTTLTLPFTIWILRGYLLSLPVEIEDAARVDGCSYLGVLFRVVLPAVAPALAVVATLSFINSWNEYLLALVLVNDPDKQVLGIGLTSFASQFATDFPGLFAMAVITTLPVLIVFLVFQRAIVGGLSTGAVK
jgi:N,N'-diacetylchitobiose transport system permease protein